MSLSAYFVEKTELKILHLVKINFTFSRVTHLDVCDTVIKMNSQGVMIETPEQYLDIFKCLRDEVTTMELPQGYYDLSPRNYSFDEGEEYIYDQRGEDYNYDERGVEYNYDQRGEYEYDQEASYY